MNLPFTNTTYHKLFAPKHEYRKALMHGIKLHGYVLSFCTNPCIHIVKKQGAETEWSIY